MIGNSYDAIMFKQWLMEKKFLADSSIYVYVQTIEAFLKESPNLLDVSSYNDFLIRKSIKKRSGHYYFILKNFIEFKIEDSTLKQKILENMIRPPERNDIKMERKYLTEEKILEVINFLEQPKHQVIALIQSLTGVRAGDVLRTKKGNIAVEDVNGTQALKIVVLGKRRKRQVVYIYDEIAQTIILNFIGGVFYHPDYYFLELSPYKNKVQSDNEFMLIQNNYRRYWEDLKFALLKANIERKDFASHDFRRCFARRVWDKYKDLQVLQGLLNHGDPKVTMKYLEQSGMKNIDYYRELQK